MENGWTGVKDCFTPLRSFAMTAREVSLRISCFLGNKAISCVEWLPLAGRDCFVTVFLVAHPDVSGNDRDSARDYFTRKLVRNYGLIN